MKLKIKLIKERREKFTHGFDFFTPYVMRSGNMYTGLTEADVKRLAKATGMSEKALMPPVSTDQETGSYWKTFSIRVDKKGLEIDTSDPYGELQYLFARGHYLVAEGRKNMNAVKRFIIVNLEDEAMTKNEKNRKLRKCYAELEKMTMDEMRKALRVLAVNPLGMSNELVESRLSEEIEKKPEVFIASWIENKDRDKLNELEQFVQYNIIRRNRNIYTFGSDVIGHSRDETLGYIKDPKNNDIYMGMVAQLANRKTI